MYNQFIPNYYRRNDKFNGSFTVPFILGGIIGSSWNNNRPIIFYPISPFYFPYYHNRFF